MYLSLGLFWYNILSIYLPDQTKQYYIILLALIFIHGSNFSWLLKKLAPAAFLIDYISKQILLTVVCCKNGNFIRIVANQAQIHVNSNNIFGLSQILIEERSWACFSLSVERAHIDKLIIVKKTRIWETVGTGAGAWKHRRERFKEGILP